MVKMPRQTRQSARLCQAQDHQTPEESDEPLGKIFFISLLSIDSFAYANDFVYLLFRLSSRCKLINNFGGWSITTVYSRTLNIIFGPKFSRWKSKHLMKFPLLDAWLSFWNLVYKVGPVNAVYYFLELFLKLNHEFQILRNVEAVNASLHLQALWNTSPGQRNVRTFMEKTMIN